jgi:hypothetical protein
MWVTNGVEFCTLTEAAHRLGIHKTTLSKMVKTGTVSPMDEREKGFDWLKLEREYAENRRPTHKPEVDRASDDPEYDQYPSVSDSKKKLAYFTAQKMQFDARKSELNFLIEKRQFVRIDELSHQLFKVGSELKNNMTGLSNRFGSIIAGKIMSSGDISPDSITKIVADVLDKETNRILTEFSNNIKNINKGDLQ